MRVVAARGELRIVETRHGLVLAGAGVDLSNVARNEIALLPVDPDASAQLLREALADRLGVDVGVVISDSMGRPWRAGITDTAIGVAGLTAVTDARGRTDVYGNVLERHPGRGRGRARGRGRSGEGQARRRPGRDRARLRARRQTRRRRARQPAR